MDTSSIAALLESYVTGLSEVQLAQVYAYLELLRKWNARMNLTAVRDEKNIVTRHFGESLFAAVQLLGHGSEATEGGSDLIDVGSGAGFPGLPMKIYDPSLRLTLVESQNKKATFLKEVVRALNLDQVEVVCGRAEDLGRTADVVTLRAVERFSEVLPVAAAMVAPRGRLALLVGEAQIKDARHRLPSFSWRQTVDVPGSSRRVLLVGDNPQG